MKICYLADAKSAHTQRWVRAVKNHGHQVILISFRPANLGDIPVYYIRTPKVLKIGPSAPLWSRFHYLFAQRKVKKIVDDFCPDIIHSFYATSYGFVGARLKHPSYYISVWGQDITKSRKNILMGLIVKYALKRADKVFCTSKYLIRETSKFLKKADGMVQLPFGIDVKLFKPDGKEKQHSHIQLGCIKPLEAFYGIETLLKAFDQAYKLNNNIKLTLIYSGSFLRDTQNFIEERNLGNVIDFVDPVEHHKVPSLLNTLDILIIPSLVESFGVAALEGSACGLPIIGTMVGGIPEVIKHEVTGLLIPSNNVNSLTDAVLRLAGDESLRVKMGTFGRRFVIEKYAWEKNVKTLLDYYDGQSISPRRNWGKG